jgi:hypothetical protein
LHYISALEVDELKEKNKRANSQMLRRDGENLNYFKVKNCIYQLVITLINMLEDWSIRKIVGVFGFCLVVVFSVNLYLILIHAPEIYHYISMFVALFFALLIFHSINIKLKRIKKRK